MRTKTKKSFAPRATGLGGAMRRAAMTMLLCLMLPMCMQTAWAEDVTISSAADWNSFASSINNGTDYSGQTVDLTADIIITKMAGASGTHFNGIFNGHGHTITVVLSGDGEGTALFYEINGATIRNLKVEGSVISSGKRPATFASFVEGNCTIVNCWSSVHIVSTKNATENNWIDGGAMVGRVCTNATLNMQDCLFSGSITYSATGYEGGGMVGWTQSNSTTNLTRCLFMPTALKLMTTNSDTYIFVTGAVRGNLTNCYYNAVAKASTVLQNEGLDASNISAAVLASALGSGWGREEQVVLLVNVTNLSAITANYTAQDGEVLTNRLSSDLKLSIADGATVTIRDMTIPVDYNTTPSWAGINCLGDATIILEGTNSVWSTSNTYPAIHVPTNKTLTIQGDGALDAKHPTSNCAGIGGGSSYQQSCGNIVIKGGTITAMGGTNCPGIGSGCGIYSNCGSITISGGNVTATGGTYAAGIGSGSGSGSGINGGSKCGKITISGGIVTAKGGVQGAGIGSGSGYNSASGINNSICNDIKISGGNVTATGGTYAAGIGSGYCNSQCSAIYISGGTVTATGGENGAGIGNGYNVISSYTNHCSGVAISGGTVTATGGNFAAGIGSGNGQYSIFVTATISGGNVTATGGQRGAGIGCGCGSSGNSSTQCNSINIKGGTVTATGGFYAAGIGSSYYSKCNEVIITNDAVKVTAIKGSEAPTSIGKGQDGTCTTVKIGGTYYNGITESPYICPIRNLTFADDTAYPYTDDYFATTATYTKTITGDRVGKHLAWLLPFDYTLTAEDLGKFSFYKINMIANSPSQEVEATDKMWVFLTKLETAGTVLHANMPYVYKANVALDNDSYSFSSTNATLKAKDTGVIAKSETLEDVYSFYATYENTTATTDDPFYYVNVGGSISFGNSVTVGPYRWIIRKTNKYGNTSSYAREMRFFDGEEDDATAIEAIDNGKLKIDNDVYDLSGRKIVDGQSSMDKGKLPRGIYIIGGRKVAIK